MRRRTFFGGLAAAVGGWLGMGKAQAESHPKAFDPTVAPRGRDGAVEGRAYRFEPHPKYPGRMIGKLVKDDSSIKIGDKVVMLGQEGDDLWLAVGGTVRATFPPDDVNDSFGLLFEDDQADFICSGDWRRRKDFGGKSFTSATE